MARRERADAAAAQVKVMSAATKRIDPPSNVPLSDDDLPFFASVLAEFARSEWTAHQLELAAMLARTMCDLEKEQRMMRAEGSIVTTEKGTPVINPRKTAIQMHYSNIHSARRSLALHARAQSGEARDVGKRRAIAKDVETDNPLDDELLARPN